MDKLKIDEVRKGALIVAAFVAFLVLKAIFQDYISYRVNLVELRINQKKLAELEGQHNALTMRLDFFKTDKQNLESKLFNKNGLATFLQSMPDLASRSGVKVLSMSSDNDFRSVNGTYPSGNSRMGMIDKGEPELKSLPIRTVIQGPLVSVENFLIDLEQYKQLISVKNLEISVKDYPVIEGEFTLTAFIIDEGT